MKRRSFIQLLITLPFIDINLKASNSVKVLEFPSGIPSRYDDNLNALAYSFTMERDKFILEALKDIND